MCAKRYAQRATGTSCSSLVHRSIHRSASGSGASTTQAHARTWHLPLPIKTVRPLGSETCSSNAKALRCHCMPATRSEYRVSTSLIPAQVSYSAAGPVGASSTRSFRAVLTASSMTILSRSSVCSYVYVQVRGGSMPWDVSRRTISH